MLSCRHDGFFAALMKLSTRVDAQHFKRDATLAALVAPRAPLPLPAPHRLRTGGGGASHSASQHPQVGAGWLGCWADWTRLDPSGTVFKCAFGRPPAPGIAWLQCDSSNQYGSGATPVDSSRTQGGPRGVSDSDSDSRFKSDSDSDDSTGPVEQDCNRSVAGLKGVWLRPSKGGLENRNAYLISAKQTTQSLS